MLENHDAPCGEGVSASECPPIKVTNNCYGPVGGGEFDPNSATVKLQRALAAEGVVTVWAAGNDGGDGSESVTNPSGQDPTGGIISVASYYDQDTGTRDGVVSEYSSRGDSADPSTWPDLSAPGENITSACRPYLPICSTGLDPRNGPGPAGHRRVQHDQRHVDGRAAHRRHRGPAVPGRPVRDAGRDRGGAEGHRRTGTPTARPTRRSGGYSTSYDKGTGLVDVVAAVRALTGA